MLRCTPRRWSFALGAPEPTATPATTPAPVPADSADATTPVTGLAGVPGVSEATLARLLDTPLTAYTGRVDREGESFHRVVATGAPSGSLPTPDRGFVPSTAVRNYSAVVLFDEAGHLEQVAVWYTLVDSLDPIAVRFRVVYDRRGTTTVTRPAWVDGGTENGTAT